MTAILRYTTNIFPKTNSRIRLFVLFGLFSLLSYQSMAQVTWRERTRWTWTAKYGVLANNPDYEAQMWLKDNIFGNGGWFVKPYYSAMPEVAVSFDAIRMRGAVLGLQLAGSYMESELNAKSENTKFRLGITPTQMLRGTLMLSFNGTDPYTMFQMPYHSQNEAVLGVTLMGMRSEDVAVTDMAKDSIGISEIKGGIAKAAGIYFGLNWRIGESGWVFGVSASLMWHYDRNHWINIKTDESSAYTPGYIDMAPRFAQAGFGYHF